MKKNTLRIICLAILTTLFSLNVVCFADPLDDNPELISHIAPDIQLHSFFVQSQKEMH